uniref:Putative secreted protein n=1 Tax=Ixodes ricinus TaxID=34613 RepID=A0A6B0TUH7_IXORI
MLSFSSWATRFSRFWACAVAFSRSMMSTSTSLCSRDFCFSRLLQRVSRASSCSSYSEIFWAILRLSSSTSSA